LACNVVGRDELVVGVHGQLGVVADHGAVSGGHFARVGIGHGHLFLFVVQLGEQFLVPVLPVLQLRNLGGQFR
jgi:hypothetical protein